MLKPITIFAAVGACAFVCIHLCLYLELFRYTRAILVTANLLLAIPLIVYFATLAAREK